MPQALQRLVPWLTLAGGLVAAGVWGGDRLVGAIVARQRPRLERQLSKLLGHPLSLGPYQGIGPGGLRLGPSRIGPGSSDRSNASVEGVQVALAPWASLRQGLPVLEIGLLRGRLQLVRNARGQLWVLGPAVPGQKPPRLNLNFRLLGAARLELASEAGGGAGRSSGALEGQLRLRPHLQDLQAQGRLRNDGGGLLPFSLRGQWARRDWQITLKPERLPLAPLLPLLLPWSLPAGWNLAARLDGSLALGFRPGQPLACRGQLTASELRLSWLASQPPLVMPRLPLRCQGEQLSTAGARWSWAGWGGNLTGSLLPARRWDLRLQASEAASGARLTGQWRGAWQTPQLDLEGRLALPGQAGQPATLLPLSLVGRLRLLPGLAIEALQARSNGSQLQLAGPLLPTPALRGQLKLLPAEAPLPAALRPWLGAAALPMQLQLDGNWRAPQLAIQVPRQSHPLLESWQASLLWRPGALQLVSLQTPHLWAAGGIPIGPTAAAPLQLDLQRFPLHRLGQLLGADLHGWLSARGSLRGSSVATWSPDLSLSLEQPGAGPLTLAETWAGTLQGGGTPGSGGAGGRLALEALAPAEGGRLLAQLDRSWLPRWAELKRRQGRLQLTGSPLAYRWQASAMPLQGLELTLGPRRRQQPLQGSLSGEGTLAFQPFAVAGRSRIEAPVLLGVRARELQLEGSLRDQRFRLSGALLPGADSRVALAAAGQWRGAQWYRFEGRGLAMAWLEQLAQAWPLWRGDPQPPPGSARDLPSLAIDTVAASLQEQLKALARAKAQLALVAEAQEASERPLRLGELGGLIDADLTVRDQPGQSPWLDLVAKGHLWHPEEGRDRPAGLQPFVARLQGRLVDGAGSFSIEQLPLDLLALFTPLPAALAGSAAIQGRYRLGGRSPSLSVEVGLVEARLGDRPLQLQRGSLALANDLWSVDAALRAAGADSSVELRGQIPVDPQRADLELRLASRGDGLTFLASLAGQAINWRRGSADLQLLVRGSLRQPIANGFLRCSDAELDFIGQRIRNLDATLLFDFDVLRLQSLQAAVGPSGRISGEGAIGLVRYRPEAIPLSFKLQQVPFSFPRISGRSDGTLTLSGSLVAPVLSGELRLSRGRINAQPGQLATESSGGSATGSAVTVPELVEQRWTFREPLVLLGPDVESRTAASIREAVPKVSFLELRGLLLSFGPDLRVVLPNVASFSTGGSVRLTGRLDPSLRASGVVRLLGGR
ncbi:MAG: translocation/assembly module TamB domain-containing protein, partial [Prochlorococcaceae cyanobacterium]